jgi:Predicted transcriptional regulators
MSRSNQTDLAVLAVLSAGPLTGYAVREAVTTHLGAFWSESFGQIYPALARLRDSGLVEADAGARGGSTVHRLTSAGRARLVELMREEPVSTPPRNGLLLRLFFGDALGPAACRSLVAEARAAAEERLEALASARRLTERDDPAHRPYRLLTISAGEHSARAAITWADETLAALDALAHG